MLFHSCNYCKRQSDEIEKYRHKFFVVKLCWFVNMSKEEKNGWQMWNWDSEVRRRDRWGVCVCVKWACINTHCAECWSGTIKPPLKIHSRETEGRAVGMIEKKTGGGGRCAGMGGEREHRFVHSVDLYQRHLSPPITAWSTHMHAHNHTHAHTLRLCILMALSPPAIMPDNGSLSRHLSSEASFVLLVRLRRELTG